MMVGIYNRSVILTYIGVAISLFGMHLALTGKMNFAFSCLIIAGICDLFDGKIANMCKRTEEEKLFGIEIDSLADMVNFIAFPIVILFALDLHEWYHILIYILYTLTGITRLAFFNIGVKENEKHVPSKYYRGLPVTYSALIFPIFWLLSLVISYSTFTIVYSFLMFAISVFFVLDVKILKPKGKAYLFFSALAVILLIFFLGII